MSHIARQFATIPVQFVANTCESQPIDVGHFAGGIIYLGPNWTTSDIAVKVSPTNNSIFVPLYDKNDSLVKITLPDTSRAYPFPEEAFGARFVRLYSVSSSTTAQVQAADRTLYLMLKG
jgi:hypothetical protein